MTTNPYQEQFPEGTSVRIADRHALDDFLREWKFHHKLTPRQLDYADAVAVVARIMYYHGGDVLYELAGVPGIWHESCLASVDSTVG